MALSESRRNIGPSSRLYGMLPTGVQIRLPLISSLRRSFSAYAICTQQYRGETGNHCRSTAMGLGYVAEQSGIGSSSSGSPLPQALRPQSTSMDATRRHARQGKLKSKRYKALLSDDPAGLALLENAVMEAQSPDPRNQAFSRRAYIDSLTYLLQALPSDLTEVEVLYLQQSFPQALQTQPHAPQNQPHPLKKQRSRSALHRVSAALILQLFILYHTLLPYIKYILQRAHHYDRQHHVSEKIIATTVDKANKLRRRGVETFCLLLSISNGTVWAIVSGLAEGISGGIHEGVAEGISIVRTRQNESDIQSVREIWGQMEGS